MALSSVGLQQDILQFVVRVGEAHFASEIKVGSASTSTGQWCGRHWIVVGVAGYLAGSGSGGRLRVERFRHGLSGVVGCV